MALGGWGVERNLAALSEQGESALPASFTEPVQQVRLVVRAHIQAGGSVRRLKHIWSDCEELL